MKRIKMKLILLACAAIVMAAACMKPQKYYIDQESKDYCLFDVGSYWIFQDSATLKTDSLVVVDVQHDFMKGVSTGGNEVEVYGIYYSCFYEDTSILIYGLLQGDYDGSSNYFCPESYYYTEGWDSLIRFPYASCFIYNDNIDAYYLSYPVSNATYYDVKQFSNTAGKFGLRYKFKVFYAKHVGFLRNEITTIRDEMTTANEQHFVSNLIRYNVKPYKK